MAMAGTVVFFQQFGAEDVAGHQVRGELHAPELQFQCLPQRAYQQGLAQPRRAFQQAVATGQQADQQLLDHGVLADHGVGERSAQIVQARQQGIEVGGGHGRGPFNCSMRTSRC
ncbi:hypothetical protein D3C81_1426600 [compost metagenome]